jgi:hypothetical protein
MSSSSAECRRRGAPGKKRSNLHHCRCLGGGPTPKRRGRGAPPFVLA